VGRAFPRAPGCSPLLCPGPPGFVSASSPIPRLCPSRKYARITFISGLIERNTVGDSNGPRRPNPGGSGGAGASGTRREVASSGLGCPAGRRPSGVSAPAAVARAQGSAPPGPVGRRS
jgi:hypothetical protein